MAYLAIAETVSDEANISYVADHYALHQHSLTLGDILIITMKLIWWMSTLNSNNRTIMARLIVGYK